MNIKYIFLPKTQFENITKGEIEDLVVLTTQIHSHEQKCNLKFGFKIDDPNYSSEMLQEKIIEDCDYLTFAKDGEKIIGFICSNAGDYGYIPNSTYLENCVILEEYRNLGIGTRMMKSFVSGCKKAGIKTIILHVNANNQNAEHVYQKSGYKKIGTVMAKNIL